ncbi:MAG TPA: hypothetical protein VEJ85_04590 [Thermoplasmata archaeon]|nr:hypothetical protein [Thermoplasmata archaeon]
MAEQTDAGGRSTPVSNTRARRLALYGTAWVAGAVPLFAVITALWLAFPTFGSTGTITIGAFALAYPVVVRRLGVPRRASFVRFLLLTGIVFAVVSVFTGWGNGLTDEPFTTPRFVTLLWSHQDPYVVPLVFNYVQYGQTIHSYSIYPYLPLLMFFQVPGLSYKWVTLGCWVGMVLLVRNRFDAGVYLAQPYVVVMAASGYNDFPVLLLLTLAFVGFEGVRLRWAQILALGMKQFANVIVLGYYALRRDWKNFLVTAGVSAAYILPFVIWSGPTVLCPTVFADRLSSCPNGGTAQYLLNYAVWPVWVLAVFYPVFVRQTRASAATGWLSRRLAGRRPTVDDLLRVPSFAIVGAAGALAGVTVVLASGLFLGDSLSALALSALLATVALDLWVGGMDATGIRPGRLFGRPVSEPRFRLLVAAVSYLLLATFVLGGAALRLPVVDGAIVGASLGALWESVAWFASTPAR